MTENSCFFLSALILKSDWIRHDNGVTCITYRLRGVSIDLGLSLPEVVTIWKKKQKETILMTRKILMTNRKINSPTWPPTELKKWNTCCYYYVTSAMYKTATERWGYRTRHASCLTQHSWAHILTNLRQRETEIWCNPKKKKNPNPRVIPKRWATSLVDERILDFIALWNPSMLEQLVGSLMHHDWKVTTRLNSLTPCFFCSHRNPSIIPI